MRMYCHALNLNEYIGELQEALAIKMKGALHLGTFVCGMQYMITFDHGVYIMYFSWCVHYVLYEFVYAKEIKVS